MIRRWIADLIFPEGRAMRARLDAYIDAHFQSLGKDKKEGKADG